MSVISIIKLAIEFGKNFLENLSPDDPPFSRFIINHLFEFMCNDVIILMWIQDVHLCYLINANPKKLLIFGLVKNLNNFGNFFHELKNTAIIISN